MRTLIVVLAGAALAGCATQITHQQMQAMGTFQLCEALILGRVSPPDHFLNEVSRRGDNCNRYMPMIQARQQQRQAESDALFRASQQLLQQSQQPMPNRIVNCSSNRIGNTVQTQCF